MRWEPLTRWVQQIKTWFEQLNQHHAMTMPKSLHRGRSEERTMEPILVALHQACAQRGLPANWQPSGDCLEMTMRLDDLYVTAKLKCLPDEEAELPENTFDSKVTARRYITGGMRLQHISLTIQCDSLGQIPEALHLSATATSDVDKWDYVIGDNGIRVCRDFLRSDAQRVYVGSGLFSVHTKRSGIVVHVLLTLLRKVIDATRTVFGELDTASMQARLASQIKGITPSLWYPNERCRMSLLLAMQLSPTEPWLLEAMQAWLRHLPQDTAERHQLYSQFIAHGEGELLEQALLQAVKDVDARIRLLAFLHLHDAKEISRLALDERCGYHCRVEAVQALVHQFPWVEGQPVFAQLLESTSLDVRCLGLNAQIEQVLEHHEPRNDKLFHYRGMWQALKPLFEKSEPEAIRTLSRTWSWCRLPRKEGDNPAFFDEALHHFLTCQPCLAKQGEHALVPILSTISLQDEPEAERFLLGMLARRGALCREAARALGRCGSVHALLPLRQCLQEKHERNVSLALKGAISAIELRVGQGELGGLSLAGEHTDDGALSIADAQGGEVSVKPE